MSSAISAPTSKHLHLFFTSIKLFTCRPDFTFAVHQHSTCIKQSRSPANVHQHSTCIKQSRSQANVHQHSTCIKQSRSQANVHQHPTCIESHHDAPMLTSRQQDHRTMHSPIFNIKRRNRPTTHSHSFHAKQSNATGEKAFTALMPPSRQSKAISTKRCTAAGDKPK